MLRRRSSRPALICSLIIHLIAAIIMMHLQIKQRQLPFFDDPVLVEITHFQRPMVEPPEPVEPPPPRTCASGSGSFSPYAQAETYHYDRLADN